MEYNIFKSTIWKSKIKYDRKDEFINNIEKNYEENPNLTPDGWKCNIHSSYGQKLSNIPQDLINIIEKKSNEFLDIYENELNIKENYFISNIWYNAYKGQQFQEPHVHGNSCLFSGCYYLKFNKKIHNQTIFYNPNFSVNNISSKNNPFFELSLDCDEDDLIIFPSNLWHGTEGIRDKNSNCMRITVSFNISIPTMVENKKFLQYT